MKTTFMDEITKTIANELIVAAEEKLPTIDGGGCVDEKQIEDCVVSMLDILEKALSDKRIGHIKNALINQSVVGK